MEVPEEIQDWQVPQMLLHTFAENVFKHVIEPDTFTTVLLQCAEKEWNGETMLRIRMENSGKPFPEEVLLRMSEPAGEIRRTGSGVGLGNIRLILEYMYGRRDLLHLENDAMGGARITVYIPEKPAEEKKV